MGEARTPEGMRIYAIGDVHGCADLLEAMHANIDAEIARDRPADWRIVHVGDYCDRGSDTRRVVDFLIRRMAGDDRVIALKGNHDRAGWHFWKTGPASASSPPMAAMRRRRHTASMQISTTSPAARGPGLLLPCQPRMSRSCVICR